MADVTFPSIYRDFLSVIDVVNLDLTWIVRFGCHFDTNFYHRLLVVTLAPIVLLGMLAVTYWIANRRYGHDKLHAAEVRRKHVSAVVLVTFLVYSSASTAVFQTFACDALDDGHSYLRADYSLKCHRVSGETDNRHLAFMVYAGLMILVYPVGIPTLYGFALFSSWRRRWRRRAVLDGSRRAVGVELSVVGLEREDLPSDLDRSARVQDMVVTDLCKPYKSDRFYYEVVECIRRVVLTGAVVFIFPDSVAQVSITFLLALVFYSVAEVLQPYECPRDCWISRLGYLVVLLSMFVALLLKADTSDETVVGGYFLSVVLVVTHALMILAIVAQSMLSMYMEVVDEGT